MRQRQLSLSTLYLNDCVEGSVITAALRHDCRIDKLSATCKDIVNAPYILHDGIREDVVKMASNVANLWKPCTVRSIAPRIEIASQYNMIANLRIFCDHLQDVVGCCLRSTNTPM